MDIGVSAILPAYNVNAACTAHKAEELGFESIWYAEHPIMPVQTTSCYPGSPDGTFPETYAHFADPFIALAQASGATKAIKLGTGIILVPERNPLLMAKEISTLDLFSGGRFLFPPVKSYPKPAQRPHPPILLGGSARNVLKRTVAWGDGWIPSRVTPDQVREGRVSLDTLAAEAGRDPSSINISVFGQPPDMDLVKAFQDAGADRVIIWIARANNEAEMSTELERIAEAVLR